MHMSVLGSVKLTKSLAPLQIVRQYCSHACAEKLLNTVSNCEPRKLEGYYFKKLDNLLTEVGQYRLEYELEPCVPGRDPLKISTIINVTPGPAKNFKITVLPCPRSPCCHMLPSVYLRRFAVSLVNSEHWRQCNHI